MSDQMSHQEKHSGCRYCQRYRRACGRIHTEATRGDWNRAWDGAAPDVVTSRQKQTDLLARRAAEIRAGNDVTVIDPKYVEDPEHLLPGPRDYLEHQVREQLRAQFFGDDGDVNSEDRF